MSEYTPVLQQAANAFLRSDRAKNLAGGGQKLSHIESVQVNEDLPMLTMTATDGRTGGGTINPQFIYRPKDREMRPADLHDAVARAMLDAAAELLAPSTTVQ